MRKIFFILLIVCILPLVGCPRKTDTKQNNDYLTLRVSLPEQVLFTLEYNNTIIREGTLEATWNDIVVQNKKGQYNLFYWNDAHYINKFNYASVREGNETVTQQLGLENRKGNISANLSSSLVPGMKAQIFLSIKANGTVKLGAYCIYRTIGIISATPLRDTVVCASNIWKNQTQWGNLTNGNYYCDGIVAKCKSVNYGVCNEPTVEITRVHADKCYLIGKRLTDEEYTIPLEVSTMDYFDESDYLELSIIDMDLSTNGRMFGERTYQFDDNLGIQDYIIRLR